MCFSAGVRVGPAFVLVDLEQAGPGRMGAGRIPVAVERAVDVVGPDVGDRHDVDVVGIERADQHAAFVAGADDADAQRVVDLRRSRSNSRPARRRCRPRRWPRCEPFRKSRRVVPTASWKFSLPIFFSSGDRFIESARFVLRILRAYGTGPRKSSRGPASGRRRSPRGPVALPVLRFGRWSVRRGEPRRLRRDDGQQEQRRRHGCQPRE